MMRNAFSSLRMLYRGFLLLLTCCGYLRHWRDTFPVSCSLDRTCLYHINRMLEVWKCLPLKRPSGQLMATHAQSMRFFGVISRPGFPL